MSFKTMTIIEINFAYHNEITKPKLAQNVNFFSVAIFSDFRENFASFLKIFRVYFQKNLDIPKDIPKIPLPLFPFPA